MLFNSFEFLVFLPIVFFLCWFVFAEYDIKSLFSSKNNKPSKTSNARYALVSQNLFVVIVSYIFYGWWDWRFLLLIAFTTFCSWWSGLSISSSSVDASTYKRSFVNKRRFYLWANIILNLGVLGYFKYYNFFLQSFIDACASLNINLQATTLQIILPVGISFYTFQALSYSIDIYKGKMQPTRDIVAFFAFVSFFPQLVAGPIERATTLLPQFQRKRTFNYNVAVDGCRQMLWGFFKKIVIADNCAVYVNQIFDSCQDQTGMPLLLAAIFFTFQIYGDFSGYSDIAIGCARLFGINLMRNFNFPYFSRDIAEFWRRWHISLTTWFRDYIYIPLGGSRTTRAKAIRNTFIIFLLSGFWHGANWTFVVWGAYHACLFMPLLFLGKNRNNMSVVAMREDGSLKLFPTLRESFQMLFTFLLIVIGWIIFRAENITQLWMFVKGMCQFDSHFFVQSDIVSTSWMIILMLLVEWMGRNKQHALQCLPSQRWLRICVYYLLVCLCLRYVGEEQQFIYFQF